ncbi:integumentary mucin B.1-like [Rhinatrema bivittatum]|uniref:integumentary mucin B.1-like n=1 Tax=Rhinatrema bivittatum TaxID=194408 RepID=UPI001128FD60|nr:integumentary mucin B.1-like [Rhinatrema bivittatum]
MSQEEYFIYTIIVKLFSLNINCFILTVYCGNGQQTAPWTVNGCNECTCSLTGTNCTPIQCDQSLQCNSNERTVPYNSDGSCCGYCEPITCLYNNTVYQVGAIIQATNDPCLNFTCTTSGLIPQYNPCSTQTYCTADVRTYDTQKCCYTCNDTCRVEAMLMMATVTVSNQNTKENNKYKGNVPLARCIGTCKPGLTFSYNSRMISVTGNCCTVASMTKTSCALNNTNTTSNDTYDYEYNITTSCKCLTVWPMP